MTKFTTTLNQIRAHHPCAEGWQKLLSHLGKTKDDDEPLSLLTVLDSNGLDDALWCARAVKGHDRDFRLFAVWAARQVQHLMTDARSLAALDVAELFAEGAATEDELKAARAAARDVAGDAAWAATWAAMEASSVVYDAAWDAALAAMEAAWGAGGAEAAEAARAAQAKRLHQMIEEGGWVGSTQPTPHACYRAGRRSGGRSQLCHPDRQRTCAMTGSSWKAKRYLDRTGETIEQACARLHADGAKIAHAAAEVGYCNSNELRKYFERTGQECPWPRRPVKRGNWGDA